MDLVEHVRFFTKKTPAFGEREFWECRICKMTGHDEPLLRRSARETAQAHFDEATKHFRALAFVLPEGHKHDDLLKWMKEEMSIFGQMNARDAAIIASQMARDFYAYEMRVRDERIEDLERQVRELRQPRGA